MKKEYSLQGEKIIALDDKIAQIEYECHDEINEELVTENIIEKIQTSLKSANYALGCQETLIKSKYTKKKRNIRYLLNILVPSVTIGALFMLLNAELYIAGISTIFGIIFGTALNKFDKEEFNKVQNKINALLVQIGELNSKLEIENKKLISIRNNKKTSLEQEVDDKQFKRDNEYNLQKLSCLENLWYQVGYNINDYYNYEQKGILRNMLHSVYTHNGELDEVERITKTHGPVLVKKLTSPRNK